MPEQRLEDDDPKVVAYRLGQVEQASNDVKKTLEGLVDKLVTREHLDFRVAALQDQLSNVRKDAQEKVDDVRKDFDRFRRNLISVLTVTVGPVVAGVILNWIQTR